MTGIRLTHIRGTDSRHRAGGMADPDRSDVCAKDATLFEQQTTATAGIGHLSEREAEGGNALIEELDLEVTIVYHLLLADQLMEPDV